LRRVAWHRERRDRKQRNGNDDPYFYFSCGIVVVKKNTWRLVKSSELVIGSKGKRERAG
jgi:hypothetical protein